MGDVIGGDEVVHVRRRNSLWREPVDTQRWRRIVAINELNGTQFDDQLLDFYYVNEEWWARRRVVFDEEENGLVTYWREATPAEVARELLEHLGELPIELAEYRAVGVGGEFDLRLMSWRGGSRVPTSGLNLVIVGTDDKGLLRIRIFDGRGQRVTDTDETQFPDQAAAIASLKQRLPGLLPPHDLTDPEKAQVIGEATSIVGQTPGGQDRRPRWNPEQRVLYVGDIEIKKYDAKASNQRQVWDRFHQLGWPEWIENPLNTDELFYQTIKDMNKELSKTGRIRLVRDNLRVRWELI
jgi:hypothetical protein